MCQIFIYNCNEVNLLNLGFQSMIDLVYYSQPGIAVQFFSDILAASKFRVSLLIQYEHPVDEEIKNLINQMISLKYMQISDFFDLRIENFQQLREIVVTDIEGCENYGLQPNSFQYNTKLEKINLHLLTKKIAVLCSGNIV